MRIVVIDDFILNWIFLVVKYVYESSIVYIDPVIAYAFAVIAGGRIIDLIARVLYLYSIARKFLLCREFVFDLVVIHI